MKVLAVLVEAVAQESGLPPDECRAVLEDLYWRLAAEGIDAASATTAHLQRYLYLLALERMGSARLARVVRILRAYYGLVARSGGPNPALGLPEFTGPDSDREGLIRSQWGTSDLFYGVPRPEGGTGHA